MRHGPRSERKELTALDVDIAKVEASIERYMDKFESDGLTEDALVTRIRAHGERAAALRQRRAELAAALEQADARDAEGDFAVPDAKTMKALTAHVRSALTKGGWPERKALMQALVHEIKVTSRQHIVPTFRVPTGSTGPKLVRALTRTAQCAGRETGPPTCWPVRNCFIVGR